jgi:hypothetical protein
MYVDYGFVIQINEVCERCAIQVWVAEAQTKTNRIIGQYNKQLFRM